MKAKASSLFYALMISLLIGILSSGFIFSSYLHRIQIDYYQGETKLVHNCASGMNILLADNDIVALGQEITLDLFNEESDSVLLKKNQWGAYQILYSEAFSKERSISKTALCGGVLQEKDRFALYLADQNKALSLCGRTKISGDCYLPEAGVKRAYIEGQSFMGDKLIDGERKLSERQIPKPNEEYLNINSQILSGVFGQEDSIVEYINLDKDSIIRSFGRSTFVLYDNDSMSINNLTLRGNVIIYSEKAIYLENTNRLENVLVYAPKVYVEEFFEGKLQIYANELIEINEGVQLHFPSTVNVIGEMTDQSRISIANNCKVSGLVLLYNNSLRLSALLELGENSLIKGQVYCNGNIQLSGNVEGSVITSKFYLKTPSSVYENHILSAGIDITTLESNFPGMGFLSQTGRQKIISYCP